MININSDNIELDFFYNDFNYRLKYDKKNNEIEISEKYESNDLLELNFLIIKDDYVNTYYERQTNDKYKEGIIIGENKNRFLKRLNEVFSNCNIIKDIINVDEFNKYMKNILIKDDVIALCNPSLKHIEKSDLYIIDIISLETNSIIGSIKFNYDDVNIKVDNLYIKNVLKLLNKLIKPYNNCISKKRALK